MFNESKATALATFFLEQGKSKAMSYLKLIKLMYLADREHLDKHNASITCDTYVCMRLGPVLSMTYMLIKRNEEKETNKTDGAWDRHISTKKYDVTLEALLNALSKKEQQSAQTVWEQHGEQTEWDLVDFTHTHCPEWKDPTPFAVQELPLQDVLKALNKDSDTIYSILLENTVF